MKRIILGLTLVGSIMAQASTLSPSNQDLKLVIPISSDVQELQMDLEGSLKPTLTYFQGEKAVRSIRQIKTNDDFCSLEVFQGMTQMRSDQEITAIIAKSERSPGLLGPMNKTTISFNTKVAKFFSVELAKVTCFTINKLENTDEIINVANKYIKNK